MSNIKLFLDLPTEITEILLEENIDLAHFLNHEFAELEVKLQYDHLPFSGDSIEGDFATKDLSPLLTINGAVSIAIIVSSLGLMINKVMQTYNHKPYVVTVVTEKTMQDEKGNPVSVRTEQPILLEPRAANTQEGFTFQYNEKGIVLKIGTEHQETK